MHDAPPSATDRLATADLNQQQNKSLSQLPQHKAQTTNAMWAVRTCTEACANINLTPPATDVALPKAALPAATREEIQHLEHLTTTTPETDT
eukprot:SAG31_NODE_871_length_11335_cov_4.910822_4_plen_92_part_00